MEAQNFDVAIDYLLQQTQNNLRELESEIRNDINEILEEQLGERGRFVPELN